MSVHKNLVTIKQRAPMLTFGNWVVHQKCVAMLNINIIKFVMISHCFSKKKINVRYYKALHANTISTLLNL
jgi:hypothetical protein